MRDSEGGGRRWQRRVREVAEGEGREVATGGVSEVAGGGGDREGRWPDRSREGEGGGRDR